MSRTLDRLSIVREIQNAASLYRQHLIGKKFLYVFEGQHIEVIYKAQNFRHLTGVATGLSARSFFSKAAQHKLMVNQIYFTNAHPYQLCVRKVKHICQVATLAGSESFMLERIATQSESYKFGTTDLNFSLCMNKEKDDAGNEIGDCYVVESLRDEDCFSKSKTAYEVTHIFSKPNNAKKYSDVLFQDSSAAGNSVPDDVLEMLDDALRSRYAPTAQEIGA